MRRIALAIMFAALFAAGCGGGSSDGTSGDFVTDLRAKSSNAEDMSDDAARAWGELVCTTFDNGGTRSDAVGNINQGNQDAADSGDIQLDDVSPRAVVDLAISDICPENTAT